MQAKAAEHLNTHPLNGYKFSINDFTQRQLDQLTLSCIKLGGNQVCKSKLKEVMNFQTEEKEWFYRVVAEHRRKNFENEKIAKVLQKLWLPETLISKLQKEKTINTKSYNYWQPPESERSLISRKFSVRESLAALPPGWADLTKFERLKQAFFPSYFVPNFYYKEPSHAYNRNFFLQYSIAAGSLVGLLMGISNGRSFLFDFDKTNSSNMYFSKYDAIRSRHDAFIKGYAKFALKWFWRIGFIVGTSIFISQSLCIYNLKDKMSYYVLGTATPCGLYKWKRGPKGMLISGIIGGLFVGVPTGFFMANCGLNPRPMEFDCNIQPQLSSPYHHCNWTEEKKHLSESRFNLLLKELNLNCPDDEFSSLTPNQDEPNAELYEAMFSPLQTLHNT